MSETHRPFIDSVTSRFWAIINEAGQESERLKSVLVQMTFDEIEEFCQDYWSLVQELHPTHSDKERGLTREDVLAASAWVVNQGKDFYELMLRNTHLLPHPKGLVHLNWLDYVSDVCHNLYATRPSW